MRIYFDNCCYNRPFDDQRQLRIRLESEAKLEIQAKILERKYELAWSYIIDFENELNPFDSRGIFMITDTEIKIKGFRILFESLGEVEAERFIALIMREPFDYTQWQRALLLEKSVAEISHAAMDLRQGDQAVKEYE